MAEIAGAIALVLATLSLLDLFLSNDQKASITAASIWLWDRLDQMKSISFIRILKELVTISKFWTSLSISLFSTLLAGIWLGGEFGSNVLWAASPTWAFIRFISFGIPTFLAVSTLLYLLESKTWASFLIRSSVIAVCAFVVIEVFLFFRYMGVDPLNAPFLYLIVYSWIICWFVVISPALLAYLFTPAVIFLEFVVRRIAENPKGPILTLSAVLAVFAAAIKAFK